MPCVISHNKGAARFAHFGKNAVSPFYGDSVTLFPFAASTETGKARNLMPCRFSPSGCPCFKSTY